MKATHKFSKTGVKNTTIKVSFTVTGDDIIKAIAHMLYLERKVNVTTVTDHVKTLFWGDGRQWYQSDNTEYYVHLSEATQLAHKYFPSFF